MLKAAVMLKELTEPKAVWRRIHGQGMAEYALILALVSVAAVATLSPLGTKIEDIFSQITGYL